MRTFKTAFVATIFSFCFLVVSSYGADVAKIGVVDIQRIFVTSSAGKAARAEINKQRKKMEADFKKKQAEIEELKERIEREALVISREKRVEKEREFKIKVNDFMLLDKKFKKERQILDRKLTINIQKEIVELAKEIGKTEGYLLIIEKSVVLYAPNTIDITDKVIRKYNASFARKAEKKTKAKKE